MPNGNQLKHSHNCAYYHRAPITKQVTDRLRTIWTFTLRRLVFPPYVYFCTKQLRMVGAQTSQTAVLLSSIRVCQSLYTATCLPADNSPAGAKKQVMRCQKALYGVYTFTLNTL